MEQQIIDLISQTLHIKRDTLSRTTPIKDIARDSMDVVEIIAVLSNEFQLSIDSANMNGIQSIGDIITYVEQHQGSATKQSLQSF